MQLLAHNRRLNVGRRHFPVRFQVGCDIHGYPCYLCEGGVLRGLRTPKASLARLLYRTIRFVHHWAWAGPDVRIHAIQKNILFIPGAFVILMRLLLTFFETTEVHYDENIFDTFCWHILRDRLLYISLPILLFIPIHSVRLLIFRFYSANILNFSENMFSYEYKS